MPALFALLAALFAASHLPGFCPAPLLPSLVYLPVSLCCFPFHAAAALNLLLLFPSAPSCVLVLKFLGCLRSLGTWLYHAAGNPSTSDTSSLARVSPHLQMPCEHV